MKLYDRVKKLLEDFPELRDSDKKLIWMVWAKKQLIQVPTNMPIAFSTINYGNFLVAPSTESIRRCRQKIQEEHPHLGATKSFIKARRGQKQDTKGTFIYRETV